MVVAAVAVVTVAAPRTPRADRPRNHHRYHRTAVLPYVCIGVSSNILKSRTGADRFLCKNQTGLDIGNRVLSRTGPDWTRTFWNERKMSNE